MKRLQRSQMPITLSVVFHMAMIHLLRRMVPICHKVSVSFLPFARAAVADPPVLILDEATSSVDTRTEALIERGMDQLMEGRTVFVIAHRLSTVRNSNAIMVLEQGKIVERGDHDDLLEQKGKYYQLYHGMFELS